MNRKWYTLFLFTVSLATLLAFGWYGNPAKAGLSISATITICGNGTIEGAEQCDGSNLDGETCVSLGYNSGSLSCSANCSFNTSSCSSGSPGGGGGGGGGYIPPPVGTKVVLQGLAYSNADITILIDGKVATIMKADSQASFKTELTALTGGVYTFSLWADDQKGIRSITFSFTSTVVAGMTTTISNIVFPPTIDLEKVNLAKGESLKIVGQTAPKSEITISVESEEEIIQKTTATNKGDWQYAFNTSPLEEGSHTARAKAKTAEGLLSSFSKVMNFFIGKYKKEEISSKADFNKDNRTNLADFSILLYWWGKSNSLADQNQDGKINLQDFSILMYWWTG